MSYTTSTFDRETYYRLNHKKSYIEKYTGTAMCIYQQYNHRNLASQVFSAWHKCIGFRNKIIDTKLLPW